MGRGRVEVVQPGKKEAVWGLVNVYCKEMGSSKEYGPGFLAMPCKRTR